MPQLSVEPEIAPATDIFDDDAPVNFYREASARLLNFWEQSNMWIARFGGKRIIAWEVVMLSTSQGHVIGVGSAAALARRWNMTKAAVTKMQDEFQRAVKLPPGMGQRGAAGRKKMSEKRKEQLK